MAYTCWNVGVKKVNLRMNIDPEIGMIPTSFQGTNGRTPIRCQLSQSNNEIMNLEKKTLNHSEMMWFLDYIPLQIILLWQRDVTVPGLAIIKFYPLVLKQILWDRFLIFKWIDPTIFRQIRVFLPMTYPPGWQWKMAHWVAERPGPSFQTTRAPQFPSRQPQ